MFTKPSWQAFFNSLGVRWNQYMTEEHPPRDGCYAIVAVPGKMSRQDVVDCFNNMLPQYGIVSFIAPVTSSAVGGGFVTRTLDGLITHDDRTPSARGYTYPIWLHVSEESGALIRVGNFDHTMTFVECLWYNMYLLYTFGQQYLDLVWSDYQRCGGSTIHPKRSPSLEWDIQDIKVCLRK